MITEWTIFITFWGGENEDNQTDVLALQNLIWTDMLAAEGMKSLPNRGAGTAEARERLLDWTAGDSGASSKSSLLKSAVVLLCNR